MALPKNEIVIARPIDFVFSFMAEKMDDYLVRLDPTLLIVEKNTEGEVGKGTQFRLISSKKAGERDPTKTELLRGLDLDALEPELRNELKVSFIEVTEFERNKLLSIIKVTEENQKIIERYTFQTIENSTILTYLPQIDLSRVRSDLNNFVEGKSWFKKLALKLIWKRMINFGLKFQVKDLKTIIEAEPFNNSI